MGSVAGGAFLFGYVAMEHGVALLGDGLMAGVAEFLLVVFFE